MLSALAAAAAVAGGNMLATKASQDNAAMHQSALFHEQKDWEKEKMQNAYTWTMQDLEKAGLNPTLMMGGAGSANMAGSSAPGAVGAPGSSIDLISALKMGKELELLDSQKNNIDADTDNKKQQFELTPELTKSVIELNNSQSALNHQEKENKFQEQINTELKNHAQEIANRLQDMDYAKRKSQYDKEMAIYIGEMQAKLKELGIKDTVIYQAVDAAFETAGKMFKVVNVNNNGGGANISKTTNINSPTVNY